MDRVKAGGYTELIAAAYKLIPEAMHRLIRPHILCGSDPGFVGLHRFRSASFGRSYATMWHVTYSAHQIRPAAQDRHTTVVIPDLTDEAPWVRQRFGHHHPVAAMVHELGHVLDEALRFEHTATPVTRYAQTDRCEAFAEAFTAWLIPSYLPSYGSVARVDGATLALFEHLAHANGPHH